MKAKKELIVAGVVGIIMILICLFVVFCPKIKNNASDIKVYKLVAREGVNLEDENLSSEEKYVYIECNVSPEDKISAKKDLKKISNFKMENSKPEPVKGNYKVVLGDDFFAFDSKDSSQVYSSKTNRVYNYYTKTYSKLVKACS